MLLRDYERQSEYEFSVLTVC